MANSDHPIRRNRSRHRGEEAIRLAQNQGFARDSMARFGLAPVVSMGWEGILAGREIPVYSYPTGTHQGQPGPTQIRIQRILQHLAVMRAAIVETGL